MNLFWGAVWILVFWGIGILIAWELTGPDMSGWAVVITGIIAAAATALLGEWWKGVKARAAHS